MYWIESQRHALSLNLWAKAQPYVSFGLKGKSRTSFLVSVTVFQKASEGILSCNLFVGRLSLGIATFSTYIYLFYCRFPLQGMSLCKSFWSTVCQGNETVSILSPLSWAFRRTFRLQLHLLDSYLSVTQSVWAWELNSSAKSFLWNGQPNLRCKISPHLRWPQEHGWGWSRPWEGYKTS